MSTNPDQETHEWFRRVLAGEDNGSQDFERVSFLTDPPEKGVRVTIEFADPDVPDTVLEFDEMQLEQNRPVATRHEGDKVAELIPSRTTTTVITGTRTAPAE